MTGKRNNDNSDRRPVVLVTGASGFIGRATAAALDERYRVIGLDLKASDDDTLACDLTDAEAIERALADVKARVGRRIAAVVHLAAYFDFTGESHPLYQKLNVNGTRALLEALQPFEVERFVYASTMLVHAPTVPGVAIDESAPLDARWAYPQSKLAAERAIDTAHGKVPIAILRFAGVYTSTCRAPTLAHQIQRIYEHRLESHLYAGDLATGQSFVHIDDAVAAVVAAIDRRAELPDPFVALVGESDAMSYAALQNAVAEAVADGSANGAGWATYRVPRFIAKPGAWLDAKLEPLVPDAFDRGEQPFVRPFMIDLANDHYEIDTSRAEAALDWRPRHRLHAEIAEMIRALEASPCDWYRENGLVLPTWLAGWPTNEEPPAQALAEYRDTRDVALHAHRWTQYAAIALGAWLIAASPSLGYGGAQAISDVVSGVFAIALAFAIALTGSALLRWALAAVGLWLALAPLCFWTPSPAAYLQGTLLGGLLMALAVAFPPEPGAGVRASIDRRVIPPGWDHSPSDFARRLRIVALAFIGLFISHYLAAYQLGHIDAAWDPFFGAGTQTIVTSSLSKAWPLPDAGVGGLVYLLEIVAGVVGGRARWRTMPWLVLAFGALIVPLGSVSIYFVIVQPILIGTWCTLCLVAAAAMLTQIPLVLDEVLATLQLLRNRSRAGRPWLWVLLRGDGFVDRATNGAREPVGAGGGFEFHWPLAIAALVGVALMCSRLLVGAEPPFANANHLIGALTVVVVAVSSAEVARSLRWLIGALGIAALSAPLLFTGIGALDYAFDIGCGLVLMAACIPKGRIRGHYGKWNRYIL